MQPASLKPQDWNPPAVRAVVLTAVVACIYFLAARLGLTLLLQPEGVAVFWPASGFAAGALVLLGPAVRLPLAIGVAVATIAANLLGDRNELLAVAFGICNAGEALLLGAILERQVGRQFEFANLKALVWFFAAAAVSTAIMAAAAAIAIRHLGTSTASFASLWQTWWEADAIGIIMFAPLLITLGGNRKAIGGDEIVESVAVLAVLAAVTVTLYFSPPVWAATWVPSPVSVIFPVLLWLAARARPVCVTAGIFMVALLMVWTMTNGVGRLGDATIAISDRAYTARIVMVSLAFVALAFMSVFTERRRGQDALAEVNRDLEQRVRERTQQLEQEMQLREHAQVALAQAQRMEALGQLTGGIAHDLNNMLTAVSGNLELAEERITDQQARRSVRQAIDAVELGASFNQRLVSFAEERPQGAVTVDLNARASNALQLIRRGLGEQIEIITSFAPDAWFTVSDPGEIESAVVNMALNARDAMAEGGTLTIKTRNVSLSGREMTEPHARPGDYVVLSVQDTGLGMTQDVMRRAIEPFFTTKEPGKGTGLGLSSVYALCRRSGGFLNLASEPGRGTEISLYLPRSPEGSAAVSADTDAPHGDGEIVLVVEDNDQVRRASVGRLEALGYVVLEAANPADALKIVKAEPGLALMFSDVVLPGVVNGYELRLQAQKLRPDLPVLLTSGHHDVLRPAHVESSGAAMLNKPYSRSQLARAVARALKGHSARTMS